MNAIYWSILRHNASRYRRSTMFILTWFIFCIWLFSQFIWLYNAVSLFRATIWSLFWIMFYSTYFWQMGWSIGKVDAMTGMQKQKHEKDRLFIAFMSTLPVSRWTHYWLQTLLYILISAVASIVSTLAYLMHPFFNGYPLLVIFIQLVLFCALLFFGALQTVTAVPFALRGPLSSIKNPLVIRSIITTGLFMLLLFFPNRINSLMGEHGFENFVLWVASHPSVLGLGFLTSAGGFYLGAILFNRAEIR